MTDLPHIIAYTDGGCSPNPGPGGWGVVLQVRDQQRTFNGGHPDTTNNRMEMTAAIEALRRLKRACKVTLYTDSQYVQRGITEWISGWKRRGWKTAARKPVKNRDLWMTLDDLCQKHEVEWRWVKAHDGNEGNELADRLVVEGRAKFLA